MPDIRHVIVLMLENRSFDSMLGQLYPAGPDFDGLTGTETNFWHDGGGTAVPVWTDPVDGPAGLTIPDPDPGELFLDIQQQLRGAPDFPQQMGGFVDNYMSHATAGAPRRADAVMHYFDPGHLPVLSGLARAFGVSDRCFASAPCQTWPNRLFAHTASAGGDVNNTPLHVPYMMETSFERVAAGGKDWRIYYHDFPQSLVLGRLWPHAGGFCGIGDFLADAAAGRLPAYGFIEPRYYPDLLGGQLPNDQHPPHDVAAGEALIAQVYNALRAGPGWKNTLFLITYDEHGGCYDHVFPGPAAPPGGTAADGYAFNGFGVRVPAVIVSPYMPAGSIVRPQGQVPFDHSSIFRTLQDVFALDRRPLTPRSAAAPSLLPALSEEPENDGPSRLAAPVADLHTLPGLAAAAPNHMQQSLAQAAARLPTAGADLGLHLQRLAAAPQPLPLHASAGDALAEAAAHLRAFLG